MDCLLAYTSTEASAHHLRKAHHKLLALMVAPCKLLTN